MKVVDSSGWVEYFVNGPLADRFGEYIEDNEEIITPSVVLYEVFKKILRDRNRQLALEAAAQIGKTTTVPLSDDLAMHAAELSLAHRLPMADAVIYATAEEVGATLVTSDEHLKGLSGVEFIG